MKPPEILVNGRCLSRRVTGIERYAAGILRGLDGRVRVICPEGRLQGMRGHAWEQVTLASQVAGGSVLWSPANTGPLAVSRQALSVHDLSALEHPEWFKPAYAAWHRLFLPLLVRRVQRVITPSDYVRRKVIARFALPEERVISIPAGVDPSRFFPQRSRSAFGRYILFVGAIEPRKNLPALLEAWKQVEKLHPEVSLVIAGAPGTVFRRVRLETGIRRLHFAGYVPDGELAALYSGAELLVFPSLDEGFGLPALEAMACGTPVALSNRGALPEVAGEAGLFFDPNDPAAIAERIDQLLCDRALRSACREQGLARVRQFSWQAASEAVWQILRGVYET